MKSISAILTGLGAGLVLGLLSFTPAAQAADNTAQVTPTYTPPMLGAPTRRIGGGARGMARGMARGVSNMNEGNFFIAALVPETTAYSSSVQPTLYWAVSEPVTVSLEFVLHSPTAADMQERMPLVEKKFDNAAIGVHAINLTDYNIKLKPGVEYEWSVSIIADPSWPALDVGTAGTIKYVEAPAGLVEQDKGMSPAEAVNLYAAQGYWYDALNVLSAQIAAEPTNPQWLDMRKALLEQVGLPKVADLGQ